MKQNAAEIIQVGFSEVQWTLELPGQEKKKTLFWYRGNTCLNLCIATLMEGNLDPFAEIPQQRI